MANSTVQVVWYSYVMDLVNKAMLKTISGCCIIFTYSVHATVTDVLLYASMIVSLKNQFKHSTCMASGRGTVHDAVR